MIIVAGSSSVKLAQSIAQNLGVKIALANTEKFRNQELKMQINTNLQNEDVVIVQSTSTPVNDTLMELLLLADTAKKCGSNSITAVIPYFGYGRQDKPQHNGSISAELVAKLIEASGVNKIITIDSHSERLERFFKIEMVNISPYQIFAHSVKSMKDYIVISPDAGGLKRAKEFAKGVNTGLAIMNKARDDEGNCVINGITGTVQNRDCIIIDDIIDTGGTICKATTFLKQQEAKSISVFVTHSIFSEECVSVISKLNLQSFYTTDSIERENLPTFVKEISVSEAIVQALKT